MGADAEGIQKRTLASRHVHEMWDDGFRRPENDAFYELAFDNIVAQVGARAGDVFLEAGCGRGFQSVMLAKRGMKVEAFDFSPAVLEMAKKTVHQAGLDDSVDFSTGDLTNLSYGDGSYRYVLCWGVLMHIPGIEAAVRELSRIIEPGGYLVVHEGNMRSPEAAAVLTAKRVLRREVDRTPAGVGDWHETEAGPVFTRRANIKWLIRSFEGHGLVLRRRLPTQLTELYTKPLPDRVTRAMYSLNTFWYQHVPISQLAVGNTLILQRPS